MPFSIEVLPDQSTAVVAYEGHIHFEQDVKQVVRQLSEQPGLTTVVHDVRNLKVGFSDAVLGMAAAFKSDPNIPALSLQTVVVGLPGFLRAIAQWIQQPQYGAHQIHLFDNLDEALTYIRSASSGAAPGSEPGKQDSPHAI